MKFLITIIFIFIFNINYALSDSLYDALKITYKNNKELNAERENVNIAEQDLKFPKVITYQPAQLQVQKASKILIN